ncbi:hypothetical protein WDW89_00670 [Deltaproteobacteria bacterium TL4]
MREVNPYTQAMSKGLAQIDLSRKKHSDDSVVHFLTNMVQGRMLEHLVFCIDCYYQIEDDTFKEDLASTLVEIFDETLFGAFRKKVEKDPDLIFVVSRYIVETEQEACSKDKYYEARIHRLYLNIFRKYLGYENLESIIATLQSNPQIQKIILSSLLKKHLNWISYQTVHFLLSQDKQDLFTNAFILYGKNVHPLMNRVNKAGTRLKAKLRPSFWK